MVRFFYGAQQPIEMHRVRTVQKLYLKSVSKRLEAISKAGNNTFLLQNQDVFLDMLTDSGVNAMSQNQMAAMMRADDSYAGSETFQRLAETVGKIFGKKYFLPTHQGRACEHILAQVLVKPGQVVPMNYHFTTTKAHIRLKGGQVAEIPTDEAIQIKSQEPFKGNMDPAKLKALIAQQGPEKIGFVRLEAGTNLIGGQPISLENMRGIHQICRQNGLKLILDASLWADNLYFIKKREPAKQMCTLEEITLEAADLCDIIYFSARKLSCARGGGICTNDKESFMAMRELIPLYEGFLTYGGMSVREMEAVSVGLQETMDEEMINQGPEFIAYMIRALEEKNIPVVTPAGGLGCHIDAAQFLPHVAPKSYPAGALAAALYIVGGIRGMERGTMSEDRNEKGEEVISSMELVRLALPRRVFTLSQINYAVDRITWLYAHRDLIGGLRFEEEPQNLRFFLGKLSPLSDWQEKLAEAFIRDFGPEC